MTYTYTPQAGDVIESPDGKKRYIICTVDLEKFRIATAHSLGKDGSWKAVSDSNRGQPLEYYAALVGGMGWKLVARKET